MSKHDIRHYLIRYRIFVPMLWVGGGLFALLWLASVFFGQPLAYKMRVLGVICFGGAVLIGVLRTLVVLIRTAALDED